MRLPSVSYQLYIAASLICSALIVIVSFSSTSLSFPASATNIGLDSFWTIICVISINSFVSVSCCVNI